MYHPAMSNYYIRMRNIAESLQNNVTYAPMSTSFAVPVETKGQITRWLRAQQQQGLISCEVVVKATTCVENATVMPPRHRKSRYMPARMWPTQQFITGPQTYQRIK